VRIAVLDYKIQKGDPSDKMELVPMANGVPLQRLLHGGQPVTETGPALPGGRRFPVDRGAELYGESKRLSGGILGSPFQFLFALSNDFD